MQLWQQTWRWRVLTCSDRGTGILQPLGVNTSSQAGMDGLDRLLHAHNLDRTGPMDSGGTGVAQSNQSLVVLRVRNLIAEFKCFAERIGHQAAVCLLYTSDAADE